MIKKLGCVILSLMLMTSAFLCSVSVYADTPKPKLVIDYAPKLNGLGYVSGHVVLGSEKQKASDYSITMALSVTREGTIWAPKPTYATPKVDISDDLTWTCSFNSAASDVGAETLYVYLIPSDFVPDSDVSRTEEAALDIVVIERYSDGKVVMPESSKGDAQKPAEAPAVKFEQQKHPKETDKLSLCYSPYTNGLSPETNSHVPIEQMRWQLNLIYPYADTIRLFGVSGELEKIYKPAKDEYKMRIIAGAWFASGYSEEKVYEELDKLIDLANSGYVDIAVVGSETIYRNDVSVDKLVEYINYVRNKITDKNIPVGTSDVPDTFLSNPKLVSACDVILCTIYPFFADIPAENAAANLAQTYTNIVNISGGRQVIISESGWPTEGSPEGKSVPNTENAAKFFKDVYYWSRENDIEVIFFSEIDEAWKIEGTYGDVGSHWGHFTSSGMLKEAYYPIYQTISNAPVVDIEVVKWAEEAISDLVGRGIINSDGPSLYEPLVPITRGDFIHYLINSIDLEKITGRNNAEFTDVDPNMYYYFTIGAGQKAGLVKGIGSNLCNPKENITRQDMFVLIYRALKYAGMDLQSDASVLDTFTDSNAISDYAVEAVSALVKCGLVLGDQNNQINPKANATRAESAVLLYRVYKYASELK